ncbi:MAG TPA: hypothetical protein VE988_01520 [Gemmataceae bacterium]|nr:hypothetical protein [Gemmataceae bacterium]
MRLRTAGILTLVAIGGLSVAAIRVTGQQGDKAPNRQDAPKDAQDSPSCKGIQQLELANRLIKLGREEKNAEMLCLAAQIIHKNPTQELKVGFDSKGGKDGPAAKKTDNSPKALVAEAKKLATTPMAEAMATATEKMVQEATRDAVGGPKHDVFTIKPGEVITWKPLSFVGGKKAVVDIEYLIDGRMTLEIFDGNGQRVAVDNIPGHFVNCQWYPAVTGPFIIRLTNNDTISFVCDLLTN